MFVSETSLLEAVSDILRESVKSTVSFGTFIMLGLNGQSYVIVQVICGTGSPCDAPHRFLSTPPSAALNSRVHLAFHCPGHGC